jgi:hypothetical protein
MNTYSTSFGDRISKSVIDARVREAKRKLLETQILEYGYNFCEDCKRSTGVYLDCSHNESVDKCQKEGRSEEAYNVDNLKVRCRDCHRKHDKS